MSFCKVSVQLSGKRSDDRRVVQIEQFDRRGERTGDVVWLNRAQFGKLLEMKRSIVEVLYARQTRWMKAHAPVPDVERNTFIFECPIGCPCKFDERRETFDLGGGKIVQVEPESANPAVRIFTCDEGVDTLDDGCYHPAADGVIASLMDLLSTIRATTQLDKDLDSTIPLTDDLTSGTGADSHVVNSVREFVTIMQTIAEELKYADDSDPAHFNHLHCFLRVRALCETLVRYHSELQELERTHGWRGLHECGDAKQASSTTLPTTTSTVCDTVTSVVASQTDGILSSAPRRPARLSIPPPESVPMDTTIEDGDRNDDDESTQPLWLDVSEDDDDDDVADNTLVGDNTLTIKENFV